MRGPGSEADLISDGCQFSAIGSSEPEIGSRIPDHGSRLLQSNQIQLNLLIPAILRPQVERCACHLIDQRDGKTETRQIDALQIVTAALACVDAEMLERW